MGIPLRASVQPYSEKPKFQYSCNPMVWASYAMSFKFTSKSSFRFIHKHRCRCRTLAIWTRYQVIFIVRTSWSFKDCKNNVHLYMDFAAKHDLTMLHSCLSSS